jgi:AAA domain
VNELPVRRPHQLDLRTVQQNWLVEGLWAEQAVGLAGGEPKCCKSFLALDLAVAVATGAPALRHFPVINPGPVLLYAAEDPPHAVRQRLRGISEAADVDFDTLDLHVITAATLRLDLAEDRARLKATVRRLRPKLLVLDPFVRLHRIDENAVAEVAPLLGFLRTLQRRYATAVLLVHHARKGATHVRGGQALRGSSDLHAWGDSNLYLRRQHQRLLLTTEHRAAPAQENLPLELRAEGDALALHVVDDPSPPTLTNVTPDRIDARIHEILARAQTPMRREVLRRVCRVRNQTLGDALARLLHTGRIKRSDDGYCRVQE